MNQIETFGSFLPSVLCEQQGSWQPLAALKWAHVMGGRADKKNDKLKLYEPDTCR